MCIGDFLVVFVLMQNVTISPTKIATSIIMQPNTAMSVSTTLTGLVTSLATAGMIDIHRDE